MLDSIWDMSDEFEKLRLKWVGSIGRSSAGAVNALMGDLSDEESAIFKGVDLVNDPNKEGLRRVYLNLRTLAAAWNKGAIGNYTKSEILEAVLNGLRKGNTIYNHGVARPAPGNWWYWEIGIPQALADTMVLLGTHLPETDRNNYCAAIDHFIPDSRILELTGANRIDVCLAVAVRGIVAKSASRVVVARDALRTIWQPVIPPVIRKERDGFYADGSFIQHFTVPYAGTYGRGLLGGIGNLVIYDAQGRARWSSGTHGHPNGFLAIQGDGNIVIYDGGRAIWATNTTR